MRPRLTNGNSLALLARVTEEEDEENEAQVEEQVAVEEEWRYELEGE